MTLSMAWIRKAADTEELVFASDSRLRGGYAWDCGPKIFPFDRGDCAISFAGRTDYAYPILEQLRIGAFLFPKARNRALDLLHFKGHTLKVARQMDALIADLPTNTPQDVPAVQFILGGYSWLKARFFIWILYYNWARDRFEYRSCATLHKNEIAIIGTVTELDPKKQKKRDGAKHQNRRVARYSAVEAASRGVRNYPEEAKRAILKIVRERGKKEGTGFDMEPFEVLRDMCRSNAGPHVGGAPQVLKVYKHMNATPYALYWPDKASDRRSLFGRPLLAYEKANVLLLDPDTFETNIFPEYERPPLLP
jgi:hypothetical protein